LEYSAVQGAVIAFYSLHEDIEAGIRTKMTHVKRRSVTDIKAMFNGQTASGSSSSTRLPRANGSKRSVMGSIDSNHKNGPLKLSHTDDGTFKNEELSYIDNAEFLGVPKLVNRLNNRYGASHQFLNGKKENIPDRSNGLARDSQLVNSGSKINLDELQTIRNVAKIENSRAAEFQLKSEKTNNNNRYSHSGKYDLEKAGNAKNRQRSLQGSGSEVRMTGYNGNRTSLSCSNTEEFEDQCSTPTSTMVKDLLKSRKKNRMSAGGTHSVAQLKHRLESATFLPGSSAARDLVSEMKSTIKRRSQTQQMLSKALKDKILTEQVLDFDEVDLVQEDEITNGILARKQAASSVVFNDLAPKNVGIESNLKKSRRSVSSLDLTSDSPSLHEPLDLCATRQQLQAADDARKKRSEVKHTSLLKEMKKFSGSLQDVRKRFSALSLSEQMTEPKKERRKEIIHANKFLSSQDENRNEVFDEDVTIRTDGKKIGRCSPFLPTEEQKKRNSDKPPEVIYPEVTVDQIEEMEPDDMDNDFPTEMVLEGNYFSAPDVHIILSTEGSTEGRPTYKCRIKVLPPLEALGPKPGKPVKPSTIKQMAKNGFSKCVSDLQENSGSLYCMQNGLAGSNGSPGFEPNNLQTRELPPIPIGTSSPVGVENQEGLYDDTRYRSSESSDEDGWREFMKSEFGDDEGFDDFITDGVSDVAVTVSVVPNSENKEQDELYVNTRALKCSQEDQCTFETQPDTNSTAEIGFSTYDIVTDSILPFVDIGENRKERNRIRKEEGRNRKAQQREQERLERKLTKVYKRYKLTGEEIPVQMGRVKESRAGKRLDLSVQEGEVVGILRMKDNPAGRWLVQNHNNQVGYVEITNIEVDVNTIKSTMSEICRKSSPQNIYTVYSPENEEDIYQDISNVDERK